MTIRILSDQTISQIAAGEVVERPASVVKELLENALDAGAKYIHVEVIAGGRKLIRVSDDGCGIVSNEVKLAFARHATSKIRSIDDVNQVMTLGFRGEALSSISSVSRVTVTTRHREEAAGTEMRLEGGHLISQSPAGVPAGTVISVENLFYNTPARLKFMKKETTEKRHMTALVTRYAMAYPAVRFVLDQDGREMFRSNGGTLADVLVQAFNLDNFKQMIPVESVDVARDGRPEVRVDGYTALPAFSRADRTYITLFVNGRWVQDSSLTYAVVQAYHTLLTDGRYPVAVLMIEIAPQEVDVNVHPTKAEVRFRQPNAVFSAVQRAVREAVVVAARAEDGHSTSRPGLDWNTITFPRRQMDMNLPLDTGVQLPEINITDMPDEEATAIPEGPGAPLKPRTLPLLRVIGQVGATYIVAEGPAGMYLIDQHAAHDRVIYDRLCDVMAQRGTIPAQEIASETIDLHDHEARALERCLDLLQMTGFMIEPFGGDSFIVRGVPGVLINMEPGRVLKALVTQVIAVPPDHDADLLDMALQQISRYAAYKNGQILNQEQMQTLIRQLERCPDPRHNPRGESILLHMSGEQIAREFGR